MATTSTLSRCNNALKVRRPMRPKPLMATLIFAIGKIEKKEGTGRCVGGRMKRGAKIRAAGVKGEAPCCPV